MTYEGLQKEAKEVYNHRQKQYGDAQVLFLNACKIARDLYGVYINPQNFIKSMIALKEAREEHKHKDDNIIDIINYKKILKEFNNKI